MARYLYNTTPQIKKVNTNDTDSHFDKNFAKYHFNSGKKTLMSDRFNKSFSFSIDSPPSKKASLPGLQFYVVTCSSKEE